MSNFFPLLALLFFLLVSDLFSGLLFAGTAVEAYRSASHYSAEREVSSSVKAEKWGSLLAQKIQYPANRSFKALGLSGSNITSESILAEVTYSDSYYDTLLFVYVNSTILANAAAKDSIISNGTLDYPFVDFHSAFLVWQQLRDKTEVRILLAAGSEYNANEQTFDGEYVAHCSANDTGLYIGSYGENLSSPVVKYSFSLYGCDVVIRNVQIRPKSGEKGNCYDREVLQWKIFEGSLLIFNIHVTESNFFILGYDSSFTVQESSFKHVCLRNRSIFEVIFPVFSPGNAVLHNVTFQNCSSVAAVSIQGSSETNLAHMNILDSNFQYTYNDDETRLYGMRSRGVFVDSILCVISKMLLRGNLVYGSLLEMTSSPILYSSHAENSVGHSVGVYINQSLILKTRTYDGSLIQSNFSPVQFENVTVRGNRAISGNGPIINALGAPIRARSLKMECNIGCSSHENCSSDISGSLTEDSHILYSSLCPFSCDPGYFSTNNASCSPCPVGTFSERGEGPCVPCSPGLYNGIAGASECIPCRAGYYADEEGAAFCQECKNVLLTSSEGDSECHKALGSLFFGVAAMLSFYSFVRDRSGKQMASVELEKYLKLQ
eukprot:Nk52_evm1s228 gene=Nk52_evmTU1s228